MTARPDTLGSDVLDVLDVVGIGFGPANLAVAVVLEELAESGTALSAAFVESKPEFSWHPGMMLPGANMQIAFPKDLATMRNPRSAYTFFNYLHAKGRMVDFINQHGIAVVGVGLGLLAQLQKCACFYRVIKLSIDRNGADTFDKLLITIRLVKADKAKAFKLWL